MSGIGICLLFAIVAQQKESSCRKPAAGQRIDFNKANRAALGQKPVGRKRPAPSIGCSVSPDRSSRGRVGNCCSSFTNDGLELPRSSNSQRLSRKNATRLRGTVRSPDRTRHSRARPKSRRLRALRRRWGAVCHRDTKAEPAASPKIPTAPPASTKPSGQWGCRSNRQGRTFRRTVVGLRSSLVGT